MRTEDDSLGDSFDLRVHGRTFDSRPMVLPQTDDALRPKADFRFPMKRLGHAVDGMLPTQHAIRPKIARRITQPILRPKKAGGSMAFERTVSNQPSPIGLSGRPMHRAFRGLLGDAATPQFDCRILKAGKVILKASLISASVNKGISRRRYFYLVKYSG